MRPDQSTGFESVVRVSDFRIFPPLRESSGQFRSELLIGRPQKRYNRLLGQSGKQNLFQYLPCPKRSRSPFEPSPSQRVATS